MELPEQIDIDDLDDSYLNQAQILKSLNCTEPSTSKSQVHMLNGFSHGLSSQPSTSRDTLNGYSHDFSSRPSTSNGFSCDFSSQPSTSKDQTLESVLSDLPAEILSGCGPEELSRRDYRSVVFPRSRPPNAPVIERTLSLFHEEETIDPFDNFYFESDHLALKNNDDYRNMLKTIITLQAQRTQAVKDLDELLAAKKKALEDPIGYVNKMQTEGLPEYPGPQVIAKIPTVDWTKYNVIQPDENMRPMTRNAKNPPPSNNNTKQDENKDKRMVRGRVRDENKTETFNKPWTEEEQRRLEELLLKYPVEEVEMKRWTKIANALGNRTPKQVSSRVQKYFIKLHKRGLPVPGREPRLKSEGRTRVHRHKPSFRKSTFFPHEKLLDEIIKNPSRESIDEDSSSSMPTMETDAEMNQIDPAQEEKLKNIQESLIAHHGYKCFICGDQPIKGTRFHCETCDDVDLCSSCSLAQHQAEEAIHPVTHHIIRIEPAQSVNGYDSDYHPNNFASNSYLDPNYCPGNISSEVQRTRNNNAA